MPINEFSRFWVDDMNTRTKNRNITKVWNAVSRPEGARFIDIQSETELTPKIVSKYVNAMAGSGWIEKNEGRYNPTESGAIYFRKSDDIKNLENFAPKDMHIIPEIGSIFYQGKIPNDTRGEINEIFNSEILPKLKKVLPKKTQIIIEI